MLASFSERTDSGCIKTLDAKDREKSGYQRNRNMTFIMIKKNNQRNKRTITIGNIKNDVNHKKGIRTASNLQLLALLDGYLLFHRQPERMKITRAIRRPLGKEGWTQEGKKIS